MVRRFIVTLGLVLALALIVVSGWRYRASTSAATQNGSGATATIRFAKNPAAVPTFVAHDLDGKTVSSADWTGKVTLLTFWATWCPPCRAEIPELIELQNQFPGRVQVIGISVDEDPAEKVKQFAKQAGINYSIVMATPEIVGKFGGVPALPTSFVINREGRVVQKHVGLFAPAVYDQEVRALLGLAVDATIETFEDNGQIFLANAVHATELPGVDFSKLTPDQKKAALKRMNSESCNCGCGLTIAQCRINDTQCQVSTDLARQIVEDAARGVAAPQNPAPDKK